MARVIQMSDRELTRLRVSTDTASTAKAGARFALIGWGISHSFSCCRAPLSPERLMLSWSVPD